MKVVERSAIVPYSPAQMFLLVNDVARYPEFLPWCSGANVEDVSATERIATVRVSKGLLKTEFTTRNALRADAEILMRLVSGPFRQLRGQWLFEPIDGGSAPAAVDEPRAAPRPTARGSRVAFRMEYEFKNPLVAAALNAIFEAVCGTIVDAFAERARKIFS